MENLVNLFLSPFFDFFRQVFPPYPYFYIHPPPEDIFAFFRKMQSSGSITPTSRGRFLEWFNFTGYKKPALIIVSAGLFF